MSEKKQQFFYQDEGILFLILKLLDYPSGRQRTHNFSALQSLSFKKLVLGEVFHTLSGINRLYKIQLDQFEFDKYGTYFLSKETQPLKNHFSSLIYCDEAGRYASLKKVLKNDFDFSDLESLHEKYAKFLFALISGIDFRITLTEEAGKEILKRIRGYITLFKRSVLTKTDTNYLDFENHKKLFERRISEDFEKNGATVILSDNEFPNNFLLLHCMLALEEEGDIEIKDISNKRIHECAYHFISMEIKNRLVKRIGKSVVRKSLEPRCIVRGKILFFLPDGKERSGLEIGRKDSQKARLLQCLVETFGIERKIDAVYESIRPKDIEVSTRKYGGKKNPREIIKRTFKELQRGEKMKGFEMKINKKNNTMYLTRDD
jgi:hypothetical protein